MQSGFCWVRMELSNCTPQEMATSSFRQNPFRSQSPPPREHLTASSSQIPERRARVPCPADAVSRAWHVAANDVCKDDMVDVAEDLIAAIKAKTLGRDSD